MKKVMLSNGEKLIIREAQRSDATDMILYMKLVVTESKNLGMGPGDFNLSVDEEIAFIESTMESKNSICIIGLINNKLISISNLSGGFYPRMRHRCDLGLSVLKKYWKLGVGTGMTNFLINWARSSNLIRKINLEVKEDNESAINLYKKIGFKEEGRLSRGLFVEGKFYDTLIMGLQI